MTTFLSDDFTASDGTKVEAHTTDTPSGGAWTVSPGFVSALGANGPVINTNRARSNHSGGAWLYGAQNAAADGEYNEIDVHVFSATGLTGVTLRHQAGADKCYAAIYSGTSGVITLWRLDNSTTLVSLGTYTASFSNGSDHTIRLTATGTGASVALVVSVDGVSRISVSDSNALRITTLGRAGFYCDTVVTSSTGIHISSISAVDPAAANTITITAPLDGKVAPLSAGATGTASISLTGTYTGTAPDQWRLVLDGTSTAVSGFDWTSFTSAPTGGTFSQTIASVTKGGWYNVQVRNSGIGDIATSGEVGAGVLVAVDGQSWAWLFFSTTAYAGDSTLTPNTLLRVTGKQASNTWVAPAAATMNGAIALGNALVLGLGCPVGLIDGSWDASGLTIAGGSGASGPNGRWITSGAAGNAYTSSESAVSAAGGAAATLWLQGQGDAGSSVSQSTYYTAFGVMTALRRATLGSTHPYIILTHPRYTAGLTDAQVEAIRKAHVQSCEDADNYRVDGIDIPLHSDGVHPTATGFTTLGARLAQAVLYALGVVAYYRGPRIGSAVQISSTVYDLNLTLNAAATNFTPTTGITGFRALVSGSPVTIDSVAQESATKIRITLASAAGSLPTFDYLYGKQPTITSYAKDNTALTLPMEYNAGVTATVIPTWATVVKDGSGAAITSGTVRWAWFDGVTADTLGAPTDTGTDTPDGSGNIGGSLPNSTLTTGDTGFMVLSTSAGVAATESRGSALPYQIGTDPASVNLLNQLGSNGAAGGGATRGRVVNGA